MREEVEGEEEEREGMCGRKEGIKNGMKDGGKVTVLRYL